MSGYSSDNDASGNSVDPSNNIVDASGNSVDPSNNIVDASNVAIDISFVSPQIVSDLSSTTIDGEGYEITHAEGKDADGDDLTKHTFETTDPDLYDPQIEQDLNKTVETYNDLSGNDSASNAVLLEIKNYAAELQCSDFHGKGSIEDYNELFLAASRIANEAKQMELDVNIDGFNEFATAADQLSELFEGFILKLESVSVITDMNFLTQVLAALKRIVNLSETFGRFKQTIFSTTTIQLPQSAQETKVVLDGVMSELNCAMKYIDHFVAPDASDPSLNATADLSPEEKHIIQKSVETIDNWNTLCEFGVSIAMSNDENIQCIQEYSTDLQGKSSTLINAANSLRAKLAQYNILP
jgi:hypothetical protein